MINVAFIRRPDSDRDIELDFGAGGSSYLTKTHPNRVETITTDRDLTIRAVRSPGQPEYSKWDSLLFSEANSITAVTIRRLYGESDITKDVQINYMDSGGKTHIIGPEYLDAEKNKGIWGNEITYRLTHKNEELVISAAPARGISEQKAA